MRWFKSKTKEIEEHDKQFNIGSRVRVINEYDKIVEIYSDPNRYGGIRGVWEAKQHAKEIINQTGTIVRKAGTGVDIQLDNGEGAGITTEFLELEFSSTVMNTMNEMISYFTESMKASKRMMDQSCHGGDLQLNVTHKAEMDTYKHVVEMVEEWKKCLKKEYK